MLLKLVHRLLSLTPIFGSKDRNPDDDLLALASEKMAQGLQRDAIPLLERLLIVEPANVPALNDLGVCLADIGKLNEAHKHFELAYSLDDSYTPAVVNHAKFLVDQKQSDEGLVYLTDARAADPMFAHASAVYAGLRLNNIGDPDGARHFQLQAWLANFDNLRLANCFLFYSSYADIDERLIAAEHKFWSDTLRPITSTADAPIPTKESSQKAKRIRIGYWSPDFRNHSVRYFFRPLQANHDREKFEIFIYHDSPFSDIQTSEVEKAADHFHDVFSLTDGELSALLRSHELDILVELAGHTSNNRLNLLQHRFAALQISALGYPPTTGLKSIDAKLFDTHIVTSDSEQFYSEKPLVLPTSFWCFDPMEEDFATLAAEPPCVRSGFVTFGCVGNIAKINDRIISCWAAILRRVPHARLLIRSITFDDPAAQPSLSKKFRAAGLPLDRIDFKNAQGGRAFFESYNDIDIILDTSPFNGGTTSCFAVYMGVPVISWAGKSLLSRMGLSIMSNLGRGDLVAHDADDYIRKAINLSQDIKSLKQFKADSRKLMAKNGLGNGSIFAREFETACIELLRRKAENLSPPECSDRITVLPADELVRRAYDVLNYGQVDAGTRILNYALRHYPDNASAHILLAGTAANKMQYEEAASYLLSQLGKVSESDIIPMLTNTARNFLLAGRPDKAEAAVARLHQYPPSADAIDQCQADLWHALFSKASALHDKSSPAIHTATRIHCIVPSDDIGRYQQICEQVRGLVDAERYLVATFERTDERKKHYAYSKAQEAKNFDILLVIQKNVQLASPEFFSQLIFSLDNHDVVSYAGATRWEMLDWATDSFEFKAAGFTIESSENELYLDLILLGPGKDRLHPKMAVLDGGLLAIHRRALDLAACNADYVGADALLEQAWSHSLWQAGARLAVNRGLGVTVRPSVTLDRRYWSAVRREIAKEHNFELFALQRPDRASLSIPVRGSLQAMQTLNNFFTAES